MSDTIRLLITGEPVAKGRGRAVNTPKGIRVFTPTKTRSFEADVKATARTVMGNRPPVDGPLELRIRAVFSIPQSWPRWKREMALRGDVLHTSKPDHDNCTKAIQDALNGIVWRDDSQICICETVKHYGERPAVIVTVEPIQAVCTQTSRRAA